MRHRRNRCKKKQVYCVYINIHFTYLFPESITKIPWVVLKFVIQCLSDDIGRVGPQAKWVDPSEIHISEIVDAVLLVPPLIKNYPVKCQLIVGLVFFGLWVYKFQDLLHMGIDVGRCVNQYIKNNYLYLSSVQSFCPMLINGNRKLKFEIPKTVPIWGPKWVHILPGSYMTFMFSNYLW